MTAAWCALVVSCLAAVLAGSSLVVSLRTRRYCRDVAERRDLEELLRIAKGGPRPPGGRRLRVVR